MQGVSIIRRGNCRVLWLPILTVFLLAISTKQSSAAPAPSTPSNLTATALSSNQIRLNWSDSANESGFKIERSLSATAGFSQIATVGAGITTFTDSGLTQNTTYFYRVRAYNTGGRKSSSYSNIASATTFSLTGTDATAPLVSITSPTSASTWTTSSSTMSLGFTASDNVGVALVTWSNSAGGSGTASGTSSWSVPTIALVAGTNVITVSAKDAAGNLSQDTLTVTYTPPDTTAPTVSITSPTTASTWSTSSSTMSLSGTASDNVGVTAITWANSAGGSGTASGPTSWSVSTINLAAGSNLITVTARDAAGNSRAAT